MPLYEYQCEACRHRFEEIQKFTDPPVKVCPKCGKKKVTKLISAPGIQFKGSGWYITDYAGGSSSAAGSDKSGRGGDAGAASSEASSSDSKAEAKSDAKPAEMKAEKKPDAKAKKPAAAGTK
jgi:putative FmdB family regulatory protein